MTFEAVTKEEILRTGEIYAPFIPARVSSVRYTRKWKIWTVRELPDGVPKVSWYRMTKKERRWFNRMDRVAARAECGERDALMEVLRIK
jgi:hypothetical protein